MTDIVVTGGGGKAGRAVLRELMAECFPQVAITRDIGRNESLQASALARQLFGYVPRHSWRTGG